MERKSNEKEKKKWKETKERMCLDVNWKYCNEEKKKTRTKPNPTN